jgi:hypothetical protein
MSRITDSMYVCDTTPPKHGVERRINGWDIAFTGYAAQAGLNAGNTTVQWL